jgi:hypothetical protein
MFTVVTTNLRPEHWRERFDARIADRLFSNARMVDLFGCRVTECDSSVAALKVLAVVYVSMNLIVPIEAPQDCLL